MRGGKGCNYFIADGGRGERGKGEGGREMWFKTDGYCLRFGP